MDKPYMASPENTFIDVSPNSSGSDKQSKRSMELKRSLDMQSLLVERLIDGNGLDDLTCVLADFTKCCVFVEDSHPSILSIGFPKNIPPEQETLIRSYLETGNSSCNKNSAFENLRLDRPAFFTDDYNGLPVYRLVTGIRTDGEHVGALSMVRLGKEFSDNDVNIIKNAAGLFAVSLMQDKKIAEIELRLKGNFIEDLISTHYSDPDSIMSRARALDYNITTPHRVLVAEIENMKQVMIHMDRKPKNIADFWMELIKSIQNQLNQSSNGMVIHHNNEIILLVQLETGSPSIGGLKALSEEIIQLVSAQLGAKMFIGIGSPCHELQDFAKSYLSAKKSLEIGTYMITEGQVRSFEQFSVHALFLSTLKPAELYNYARSHLCALLDYDERHHTELVKTLQEFLYLRNNVERTARTINMSVSGLKYRLRKIEKIVGLELQDYKTSFDLQLALIILQLFGEYKIRNPEEH